MEELSKEILEVKVMTEKDAPEEEIYEEGI